jgi:hypothetical protein
MRPIYRLPPEVLAVIINFYQSEQFNDRRRAYRWVRLMLVSHMWRATMLSFPSLWSKIVMNVSVPQSGILTIVERSGSHPLQVEIPPPGWSDIYPKSVRYKHADLVAGLLPRIAELTISTSSDYDILRICRAFHNRPAHQLQLLKFLTAPRLAKLFVLHPPRLRFLYVAGVESWPDAIAENLIHIHLDITLNPRSLERVLKKSPRLERVTINGVYWKFEDCPKISLVPGVRLIITRSQNTVASLFSLGPTNHISITTNISITDRSIPSLLHLALPRDISHLRNLNDLTVVHLNLVNSGEDPHANALKTVTVTLRCSTADQETLHIDLRYHFGYLRSQNTAEMEMIPRQPPAMRVLDYLCPLDLRKVVELRMEGFVGEWGLQSFELNYFLQRMPALRNITTSDGNREIFWSELSTMGRSPSIIIEEV